MRPRKRFKPRKRLKVDSVRIQMVMVDWNFHDLNYVSVPTGEFDVWINGIFKGRFDKDERGLIDFLNMARSL